MLTVNGSAELYPSDALEWTGGGDNALTEWGECERSGVSWVYRATVREAIAIPRRSYAEGYSDYDVVARLSIWGKKRAGRYIPTHWGLRIEFGKYSDDCLSADEFPGLRGRCRSIADAQRQAAKASTAERVTALLRYAYRKNPQTKSVYRLKDTAPRNREASSFWTTPDYDLSVLHDPANWEPWASDCSTSVVWASWMPPGRYLEVSREHDGSLRGWFINHGGGSTSGHGYLEFHQLARTLGSWTQST